MVQGIARIAGVVGLAACTGSTAPDELTDGGWSLHVDRTWTAPAEGVSSPSDPLDEADYETTAAGPVYPVIVSDGGASVAIGDTPLEGVRGDDVGARLHYDLDAGTFAGGRFEVWDDGGLQGELTVFGSGVPIVSSERGPLLPD